MRASQLLLLSFWLFPTVAKAATEPDPRDLEARKKCDGGDAFGGVAQFAQLFVDTLNPIYVYRQAQCYQRNGHDENAIERYREYLRRTREVTPKGREFVEARIRELETTTRAAGLVPPPVARPEVLPALPGQAASAPAPRTPPAPSAPEAARAGAAPLAPRSSPPPARAAWGSPGPTQLSAVPARAASPAPAQSWQRLASLVLATGSGAALGAAVTFHVAREDSARQYNQHCYPLRVGACTEMEARVASVQTGAILGYAGAAVLGLGSAILYLTAPESRAPARPRAVALACSPSPGLQGVSCGGRF